MHGYILTRVRHIYESVCQYHELSSAMCKYHELSSMLCANITPYHQLLRILRVIIKYVHVLILRVIIGYMQITQVIISCVQISRTIIRIKCKYHELSSVMLISRVIICYAYISRVIISYEHISQVIISYVQISRDVCRYYLLSNASYLIYLHVNFDNNFMQIPCVILRKYHVLSYANSTSYHAYISSITKRKYLGLSWAYIIRMKSKYLQLSYLITIINLMQIWSFSTTNIIIITCKTLQSLEANIISIIYK